MVMPVMNSMWRAVMVGRCLGKGLAGGNQGALQGLLCTRNCSAGVAHAGRSRLWQGLEQGGDQALGETSRSGVLRGRGASQNVSHQPFMARIPDTACAWASLKKDGACRLGEEVVGSSEGSYTSKCFTRKRRGEGYTAAAFRVGSHLIYPSGKLLFTNPGVCFFNPSKLGAWVQACRGA